MLNAPHETHIVSYYDVGQGVLHTTCVGKGFRWTTIDDIVNTAAAGSSRTNGIKSKQSVSLGGPIELSAYQEMRKLQPTA